MTKVFVLALDGVSYDLVKRWDLKHIKQKEFGEYPTIINEKFDIPLSPQVWGSFITGKVQKLGKWRQYNKLFEWLRWLPPFKLIKRHPYLFNIWNSLIFKLRVQPKPIKEFQLEGLTIFDLIPNSVALNVPTYNLDPDIISFKERLEFSMKAYEKYCRNVTDSFVDETFRHLNEKWDLFMSWIPFADFMGHAFMSKEKKMRSVYARLNMIAFNVASRLPSDCLLLIVSDHGMKVSDDGISGTHTNYGFYSFNREIDWRPLKVTDFTPFIVEVINRTSARVSPKLQVPRTPIN